MFDESYMQSVERCVHELTQRKMKLALAESCTAGLVTYSFGRVPGVSSVLLGGLVTYADAWKHQFLSVKKKLITTHGAVSQEVVEEMVKGLADHTSADLCLAITGIAGPSGGSEEKPVGTVWMGVKSKSHHVTTRKFHFEGDRISIQEQAVIKAVEMLLSELEPT